MTQNTKTSPLRPQKVNKSRCPDVHKIRFLFKLCPKPRCTHQLARAELPQVYRRVFCSNVRLLYQERSTLQTRLIRNGARVIRHARAIVFQRAEVSVTGNLSGCFIAGRRVARGDGLLVRPKGWRSDQIWINPAVETRIAAQILRQMPKQLLEPCRRA
jgi:hypothetical protein